MIFFVDILIVLNLFETYIPSQAYESNHRYDFYMEHLVFFLIDYFPLNYLFDHMGKCDVLIIDIFQNPQDSSFHI